MAQENKQKIDLRGLACPQPVIRCKKAMEETSLIVALVSDSDQAENIRRMAERSHWHVTSETLPDHVRVTLQRSDDSGIPVVQPEDLVCVPAAQKTYKNRTVVIASEVMGRGSDELGKVLIRAFLGVLKDIDGRPAKIIFYNSGVKLVAEGSSVMPEIKELEALGIELTACGTCLDYYHLKDKLKAGRISNMFDIASALLSADSVIVV
jgi:selenium metabolism protein YedF